MSDWGDGNGEDWSGDEDISDTNSSNVEHIKKFLSLDDFHSIVTLLRDENCAANDIKDLQNIISKSPKTALVTLSLVQLSFPHEDLPLQETLFQFAKAGSLNYLQILFYHNVDPNLTDKSGNCALHFVNHVETIKRFREAKANLFIRNSKGQSPIHMAAMKNNARLVSYFLSFTDDCAKEINYCDNEGNGAFMYTVFCLADIMKHNLEGILTELRLFKMMLNSLGRFGLSPTNDDLDKAKTQFTSLFQLSETSSVEGIITHVYDEYPTEIAKYFATIFESLISLNPGIFNEEIVVMIKDEKMEDNSHLPKVTKNFEHLDHTADIQIHSWGGNMKEAFTNQILGMFEYMVPLERINVKSTLTLEATAPNDKNLNELLFNFMQTALYEASCDPYFMAREVKIISFDPEKLKIRFQLKGEEWNLERHGGFGTEIKAITYSAMKILEKDDFCEIWVIVDI